MENAPHLQMDPSGVGREARLVDKDNFHCFSFFTHRIVDPHIPGLGAGQYS